MSCRWCHSHDYYSINLQQQYCSNLFCLSSQSQVPSISSDYCSVFSDIDMYSPTDNSTFRYTTEVDPRLTNKLCNSPIRTIPIIQQKCPGHAKPIKKQPINIKKLEESYWAKWKPIKQSSSTEIGEQKVPKMPLPDVNLGKYVQCKSCFKFIETDSKPVTCLHRNLDIDSESASDNNQGITTITECDEESILQNHRQQGDSRDVGASNNERTSNDTAICEGHPTHKVNRPRTCPIHNTSQHIDSSSDEQIPTSHLGNMESMPRNDSSIKKVSKAFSKISMQSNPSSGNSANMIGSFKMIKTPIIMNDDILFRRDADVTFRSFDTDHRSPISQSNSTPLSPRSRSLNNAMSGKQRVESNSNNNNVIITNFDTDYRSPRSQKIAAPLSPTTRSLSNAMSGTPQMSPMQNNYYNSNNNVTITSLETDYRNPSNQRNLAPTSRSLNTGISGTPQMQLPKSNYYNDTITNLGTDHRSLTAQRDSASLSPRSRSLNNAMSGTHPKQQQVQNNYYNDTITNLEKDYRSATNQRNSSTRTRSLNNTMSGTPQMQQVQHNYNNNNINNTNTMNNDPNLIFYNGEDKNTTSSGTVPKTNDRKYSNEFDDVSKSHPQSSNTHSNAQSLKVSESPSPQPQRPLEYYRPMVNEIEKSEYLVSENLPVQPQNENVINNNQTGNILPHAQPLDIVIQSAPKHDIEVIAINDAFTLQSSESGTYNKTYNSTAKAQPINRVLLKGHSYPLKPTVKTKKSNTIRGAATGGRNKYKK